MESHELTPRQKQVVCGVANGITRKKIAYWMGVSPKTVEYHLHMAKNTLNLIGASDVDITRWAIKNKLVEL